MSTNYYSVLGVPHNATERQVRQRFLDLARARHPDRFQGEAKQEAELEFQQVTEAFNTLNDAKRRRQHDLELAQPVGATDSDGEQVSRVYLQRAQQEAKDGNRQQALQYLELATQEEANRHLAWYRLAQALAEDRRTLPRARVAVSRACELQPMEPNYLELAGDLFAQSGMEQKAAAYYQQALDWGGADSGIEQRLEALGRGSSGGFFGRSS